MTPRASAALLTLLAASGCKPKGDAAPASSASTGGSAAPAAASASAPAGPAAAPLVLKPPFEYLLDFNAGVQIQQVRGDAVWFTAAHATEDRLMGCAWEPGARLKCKRIAAKLPTKTPFPTTGIGSGEPYLDAQQGMYDVKGELLGKPVDRLATRHGDGVLSVRDGRSGLLRFAERGPAAKPEKLLLPPGLTSLDLVGELVLTTRSEGGITMLDGRRLPSKGPLEPEKRLGALKFIPDSSLTSGCVADQATAAWLASAAGGKLRVAAVFAGDGGLKEHVSIDVADPADLKQSPTRGLACGDAKITWAFASGQKLRTVRCQPNGCSEAVGPMPAPAVKGAASHVAALGDRVLVLEVGTDASVPAKPAKVFHVRTGPVETLASAPPRLVLRVEGAAPALGAPVLVPSGRRVLVLVPTTSPIGTVAFEVGPEGDVMSFAQAP